MHTPEQLTIIEAARTSNVAVKADAGTGKTTTLKAISANFGFAHLALAFNATTAREMMDKLPPQAKPMTFHSFGWNLAKASGLFGSNINKVSKFKTANILKDDLNLSDDDMLQDTRSLIDTMAAHCIMPDYLSHLSAFDFVSRSDIAALAQQFPNADIDAVYGYWRIAIDRLVQKGEINFNEMLIAPVLFNITPRWIKDPRNYKSEIPVPRTVLVDECQDLSAVQHDLIRRIDPSRVIAVGDPNQAIYGWRGALTTSFEDIVSLFSCNVLPMTINWRCSRNVIAHANTLVPSITAHDGAPEGLVVDLDDIDLTAYGLGDAIICRNNAPLVKLGFRYIREHGRIPFMNKGADGDGSGFGYQIKSRYRKLRGDTVTAKLTDLERWYNKRVAKQTGSSADHTTDIYECVKAVLSHRGDLTTIDRMFGLGDDKGKPADVTLSTGHRAKGMEWTNVHFLRSDLIPSRRCTTPETIQQEQNLKYVIITRAKQNLDISGKPKED